MNNKVVSLYLGVTWNEIMKYRDIMLNKSESDIRAGNCFNVSVSADSYLVRLSLVDRILDNSGLVSPVVVISIHMGNNEVAKGRFVGTAVRFNANSEESICRLYKFTNTDLDTIYHVNVDIIDDTM